VAHPVPSWKPAPTAARRGGPLSGTVRVPGDKSISHRALMLGALAIGRTEISGLLEGDDVLATAAALNALGASVIRSGDDRWAVDGIGVGALAEPEDLLNLGNSGTSARLLLGMPATSAALIGHYTLRQIQALAESHPDWLRPRWPARVQVWRELLLAASGGESPVLERARLRGLTLLAAEARLAPAAGGCPSDVRF